MVKRPREREEFIQKNLGLVHSLCRRFSGRGIEYDDLYQAGCIGLIKATDAFEEERGLCFSTYAVPVILGEIRRLFRDGGSVKVSRSLKELSLKVSNTQSRMQMTLGRDPTVNELAEHLNVSPEEIAEAMDVARPVVSLTFEGEDGTEEFDVPDTRTQDLLSDRIVLEEAFEKLQADEKKIISCRYFHGMTQSKTAECLCMTQVQVSRCEKKILNKLRELLTVNS